MTGRQRWSIGLAGAGLFVGFHAVLRGLRPDHVWLVLAGLAAWVATGRARAIAAFFAPLLIVGAVYDAQRYWADAIRGPVHVAEPYAWELAWFGLRTSAGNLITPAQWWQGHPDAWLDFVGGVGYLTFIPIFLGLAAWWRFRERRPEAQEVMWAMLWLNLIGYATYLAYPAAPPWYVDHYGLGPVYLAAPPEAAGTARFDALLHVHWFADYYRRNANVFGAIPSLHVGQTFLAVLYAWRFRSLRIVATSVWVVVLFASVYFNHHYLIDGLIGMAYAAGVVVALNGWRRRFGRPAKMI